MDARDSLSRADRARPLAARDLELLATSAYMVGRDDEYLSNLERAHHAHLDSGEALPAVRCAFWLGINLMLRGEVGRASGWLGRAQRLVEHEEADCAERGYLLLPASKQHAAAGDREAAIADAAGAVEIGERLGDPDLLALGLMEHGRLLLEAGRVDGGLALLDEAMVAVAAGELSPIVTGLLYCSVIEGCQEVYALHRAQEWTAALTRWCDEQADMVAFTGRCLIHRAEIMQLHGAWEDALEQARQAGERYAAAPSRSAAAQAVYREGEVHRLRGDLAAAERAYRDASRDGMEPQPGLALLRLAQGRGQAAAAAIRRVLSESGDPLQRARLLPAYVEIMLAAGDAEEADRACEELAGLAGGYGSGLLDAMVAHARGAVAGARGDPGAALVALRRALRAWQELGVPYEAARVRVLVAAACRGLGDDDTAALELDAARGTFEELGAELDRARVDSLTAAADSHGLTARELQVLRMVAAGRTNKAIAAELVLSQRTVDRHVSNVFAKLSVSSRSAATAYAYEHGLV